MRTYAMDLARYAPKTEEGKKGHHHDQQEKTEFFNSLKTSLHSRANEPTVHAEASDESLIEHGEPKQPRDLSDLEREAEARDARATAAQKEISDELSSLEPLQMEPIRIPPLNKNPISATRPTPPPAPAPVVQKPIVPPTPPAMPVLTPKPESAPVPTPAQQISPIRKIASEPTALPKKIASAEEPSTRESILERLRQKAAANKSAYTASTLEPIHPQKIEKNSEEATLPAPKPHIELPAPAPKPERPLPPPQPVVHEPVRVPPPVQAPAPRPTLPVSIPVPPPQPQQAPAAPSPFHSFSTDFADRVDQQKASTFSVLAAEKDSGKAVAAKPKKRTEVIPILAGIVLIVFGGAGVWFAYNFMQSHVAAPTIKTIQTLITPDSKVILSSANPTQALIQEAAQTIPDGQIVLTYTTISSSTPTGVVTNPEQGGDLFAHLDLGTPDIIVRNIAPESTVGVIHAGAETKPFFLLKVDSYDRTFSGMLNWEPNMGQDISNLYPAYDATSSAQFIDDVVASHPVRVLRDSQGRSVLMYGYTADKQVLIIARDEAAYTVLLNRLAVASSN